MIVAIDGPAGSGKSSTAAAVAEALGALHLDSGALYRALTVVALDLPRPDPRELLRRAEAQGLALRRVGRGLVPYLDGRDAEPRLRTPDVNARVSEVSAIPEVREWVNAMLRRAVKTHGQGDPVIVMDGRDIGTEVFPDAAVKVFLTASPEERARRRLVQRGARPDPELIAGQAAELAERDRRDRARPVAPLRAAEDAIGLDTTRMEFRDQVKAIVDIVRRRLPGV